MSIEPYYQSENVTLYCGDSTAIMPTLERVDAVVTDPPYGVGLDAKRAKQRDGSVSSRDGRYSFDDTEQYVRTTVLSVVGYSRLMASCVVITPGTRCAWHYPQPDEIGCWYSAAGTGLGRWGFVCSQPILYYGADPYLRAGLGARANSCGQKYPNDANDVDHPCAKPIGFAMWLAERASLENHTILDPFMGSGTTGVAAVRLGRKFIGIEIDKGYCEIAKRRIQEAEQAFALFEPATPEKQAEMF